MYAMLCKCSVRIGGNDAMVVGSLPFRWHVTAINAVTINVYSFRTECSKEWKVRLWRCVGWAPGRGMARRGLRGCVAAVALAVCGWRGHRPLAGKGYCLLLYVAEVAQGSLCPAPLLWWLLLQNGQIPLEFEL